MADPATPNVPDAPGVPPVKSAPGSTPAAVTPVTSDGANVQKKTAAAVWSIVNANGGSVFPKAYAPDSYNEIEDSKDFNIPDYPTEGGGFQSYNKVEKPGDLRLIVVKSGTADVLQNFRKTLDSLQKSLKLVNVITPGRTYKNYNLTHISAARSAERGAALLALQLAFTEERNTVAIAFSNVQNTSDANNTNGGSVQPTAPAATPGSPPQ